VNRHHPALAFAALLLVVSLVPVPETSGAGGPALLGVGLDKWVHAGGYGVLTGLLAWGRRSRDVAAVATLVVLVAGYGVGVELLQTLVPSRTTSVADAAANGLGASLCALCWLVADAGPPRRGD